MCYEERVFSADELVAIIKAASKIAAECVAANLDVDADYIDECAHFASVTVLDQVGIETRLVTLKMVAPIPSVGNTYRTLGFKLSVGESVDIEEAEANKIISDFGGCFTKTVIEPETFVEREQQDCEEEPEEVKEEAKEEEKPKRKSMFGLRLKNG